MSNASRPRRSHIVAVGSWLLAMALGGCAMDDEIPATCGPSPSEPIIAIAVTTITGSDGTNADIRFCITRKSTGVEQCRLLDDPLENDFESHEIDEYHVAFDGPIEPGDFTGFVIRNTGDGFLDDNSWTLEALRVEAVLESGDHALLYEAEEMDLYLDEGDSHDSSACTY